ncbi:MAG: hypothetical protein RBU31_05475 [Syntrophales bacterium]|jgi:hypothetical protein|nr:hypothetical protein [Syntrophales bacterium]
MKYYGILDECLFTVGVKEPVKPVNQGGMNLKNGACFATGASSHEG